MSVFIINSESRQKEKIEYKKRVDSKLIKV